MLRSFIFVLSAIFLLVLGTFISGTILTPYARELGATWFQIGLLSGGMYAVRLFICSPVGHLADKKGTLTVLKYSLLLYPFIAVAYWLSSDIYLLFGARLLHGVASAMMLPMGMAYVGQISKKGMEGKYMGIYNSCILLASGIGPFISTFIAGFVSYKATFIILFMLAIVSLLVVVFTQRREKTNYNPKIPSTDSDRQLRLRLMSLIKNCRLMALSFINIALAVISSLIGFFIIPFLEQKGIKLVFTGFIVAAYNILSGIIQIPIGKIIDKYNKFYIMAVSGIVTAAALLIYTLSDNILLIGAATILTSLGSGILLSAASAYSVLVGREIGMGKTMGFLSTSNSIGMIFGCISLSLMPELGNRFELFFYFSSVIVAICTLLFVRLWNRGKSLTVADNYNKVPVK